MQSGNVISQSPVAKTSVAPGAAVNLSVSKGGTSFAMPNVVGQSESNAKSALQGKGLSVAVSYEKSDSVTEGNVIRQSVSSGSNVQRGTSVTITVSSGKNLVSVANVVGKSESDAKSTLQNQGLKTSSSEAYSSTVAKGKVISQNPSAGSSQAAGTTIILTVSRGPEPVTVPDVTGKSRSNAESTITNLGLKVSVTEEFSDSVASGNVISQSPSSGRNAEVGSTVTLRISKGKELVPVADVRGKTKSEAQSTLSGQGLKYTYAAEQFSETVPSGSVISQSPASGANAFKGDTVTLTLSKGKPIAVVTNFTISGAGSVMEGKTLQLSVTSIQPTNADDKTPTWESKSTGIATVSSTGLVTAKAPGSAMIEARIGSVVKTCTVTVTAIPKYTITFNANGGSNMTPASQTKTHDVPLTLTNNIPTAPASILITYNENGGSNPPAYTVISRTFINWEASGGTSYARGGNYTANASTTLFAQWTISSTTITNSIPTAPAAQTVTFNYNGGSGSPTSITSSATFSHWNTAANNSGATHQRGGTLPLPAVSTTLYAQWNWSNKTITLPTPNSRSGYTFDGWYTAASGGSRVGVAGNSYIVAKSETLYAQWVPAIKITGFRFAKSWEGQSTTMSQFSIDFSTNVEYKKGTITVESSTRKATADVSDTGRYPDFVGLRRAFDRTYFYEASNKVTIVVEDAYGNTDTYTETINLGTPDIAFTNGNITMSTGSSREVIANLLNGATSHNIVWESSNSNVVSISGSNELGKLTSSRTLTANSPGTVTVTAKFGSSSYGYPITKSFTVTVNP